MFLLRQHMRTLPVEVTEEAKVEFTRQLATGTRRRQRLAYLLGDPYDDELGDQSDLPSWVLCEVSPDDEGGQLTGRTMGDCMSF